MFGVARKLTKRGILGINARNGSFVARYNPRRLYPIVDDKLQTKNLAMAAGIAVPALYGVIRTQREVRLLPELVKGREGFVIKPASGSGGKGVLVISGSTKGMWRNINGHLLTREELEFHVRNILSGIYSLGGRVDKALIEYRVCFDPVFESISYLGVPDIRIVVLLGVPVMAMVRLPTKMSDGKANLHQGAVGAGINIATGRTIGAVWKNDVIEDHPDTGENVIGVDIPKWDELLELSARTYELTGLGYQGVDIVLDRYKGPLILEVNARPGLNIQTANFSGLMPRLALVQQHSRELLEISDRLSFAKTHFPAECS